MPIFVELLQANGVEVLIDVRSHPYSRHAPHFSKRGLDAALASCGIAYIPLGDTLGGRPDGVIVPTKERVRYFSEIARRPAFQSAMDTLVRYCESQRVALMCAEEDPTWCHRRLLIGRALLERGLSTADLLHIRKGGALQAEAAFVRQGQIWPGQPGER
jgi:uncharacterized protein (DUF488 family)